MKRFIRPRILGIVVMGATLPLLLGASAPSPDLAACPSNPSPLAVFDIADRAALAQRVPGLANAPEVAGDPIRIFDVAEVAGDRILINGRPGGLEGTLHVTVYACLRYSEIPMYGPLLPDSASMPAEFRNIVVVQTASHDAWWFTDVSLDGFVP